MLEMTSRDIIPAVSRYIGELSSTVNATRSACKNASVSCECDIIEKLSSTLSKTYDAYVALDRAERTALTKTSDEDAAFFYNSTVIPKMDALRRVVDEMETITSRDAWPMPTYGDIIFKI